MLKDSKRPKGYKHPPAQMTIVSKLLILAFMYHMGSLFIGA
jgi:hypothetical protein